MHIYPIEFKGITHTSTTNRFCVCPSSNALLRWVVGMTTGQNKREKQEAGGVPSMIDQ